MITKSTLKTTKPIRYNIYKIICIVNVIDIININDTYKLYINLKWKVNNNQLL